MKTKTKLTYINIIFMKPEFQMVVDNGMIQSFLNGVPHSSMKALKDLHYNSILEQKI